MKQQTMPSALIMRMAAVIPNLYNLGALDRMGLVKNSVEIFVIVREAANRIIRAMLSLRDIIMSSGNIPNVTVATESKITYGDYDYGGRSLIAFAAVSDELVTGATVRDFIHTGKGD
jgi:hypothetical protein